MRHANAALTPAGRALSTLLLAACANRSVLTEHSPAQPRRISCCPYGSLPGGSRLAFKGEFREPQGWYHLGAGHRLYNPVLRRFNRPDRLSPFGKGGLNAYAYCLGDPVNFSDPTGRAVNPNILGFLTPLLYDRPGASIFLTFGLLALNLATAFHATPVGIAAQVAHFSGLGGAVVGMAGASVQIAGEKDTGRWVSIVGTVLSGFSVATKASVTLNTVRRNWREYMREVKSRLLGIVMPWKYRVGPPAAIPLRALPVPLDSPLMRPDSGLSQGLSMTSMPPTLSHAGSVSGTSPVPSVRQLSNSAANVRHSSLEQPIEDTLETTRL